VWTDTAASRQIVRVADRELVEIASKVAEAVSDDDAVGRRSVYDARKCPVCSRDLTSIRAARVTIDVCPEHGTWFDRDELGRLARNLEYERMSMPTPDSAVRSEGTTTPSSEMLLAILGRSDPD
jgi:Zn-finger nucleic acid-binding protein